MPLISLFSASIIRPIISRPRLDSLRQELGSDRNWGQTFTGIGVKPHRNWELGELGGGNWGGELGSGGIGVGELGSNLDYYNKAGQLKKDFIDFSVWHDN